MSQRISAQRMSWGLLALSFLLLAFGLGVLALRSSQTGGTQSVLQPLAYLPWVAAVAAAAMFLQAMLLRCRVSPWLLPFSFFFASVGLVEIARLKPILFIPQLRWLLIGMTAFLVVLRCGRSIVELTSYQYMLGLSCLVLLALPLLFGTEIGGSRNWLVLGPVQVQPSEFSKILLVLFLSAYLADHEEVLTSEKHHFLLFRLPPLRFIAPLLCIWGMAILMFVVARDLGSALLFFGIAVFMTYMATGSRSYVFIALLVFVAAAAASYALFGHVRVRFDIWLDPWADPNGMAYQVVQSLFAFGSGGVWGTGFAHGHPGLIPEVHTDFIFAAIAEELGLIGSLTLLLGYAVFFLIGIRTALSGETMERILLSAGASVVFLLQAFIIMAGVTKFLPLTGITLPFVSYGGSSMVSSYLLLGLLAVLSQRKGGHAA
ncbi:FtsW/RodA/SpoVE family cell cycle protein [Selenomonas bovis]|uniref:FtsW/RodA/SpoVE family cell cycle protein n=1 Tax=Selenomonas bovis TaxID=416586 RepID=UPI003AB9AF6D